MADLNLTISQTVQTYNITVTQDVVAYDLQPIIVLSGGGSVSGVSSIIAGTGISVDQATGDVTITNTVDGGVQSVSAGTDISITGTLTDPIVNFSGTTGGQVDSVVAGTDITVDATDPANPIVNLDGSLSPTTTLGDIIFNGGAGDVRYGIGTVGQVLTSDGSVPQWETPTTGGTVTSVAVSGSDGIEVDSGSPITTSGTIALGLNQATTKTFLDYTEEEVIGIAIEDAAVTGITNLDLNTFRDGYFTLTGNSSFTVTNLPSATETFVVNFTVKSTTTQTLALPVGWTVIGAYVADGSENYFTVIFSNFTTAGAKVVAYITQA